MLIKESSARELWCPHSGKPQERFGEQGSCCIGAYCMAWRWLGWEAAYGVVAKQDLGWCGLSGRPDIGAASTTGKGA